MAPTDKRMVWMHGEVRSPPFSTAARVEVGALLRQAQQGILLSMPQSRPMGAIADGVHELRVPAEGNLRWRLVYFVDTDAVVVLDVFKKQSEETPEDVKRACRQRLSAYQRLRKQGLGR